MHITLIHTPSHTHIHTHILTHLYTNTHAYTLTDSHAQVTTLTPQFTFSSNLLISGSLWVRMAKQILPGSTVPTKIQQIRRRLVLSEQVDTSGLPTFGSREGLHSKTKAAVLLNRLLLEWHEILPIVCVNTVIYSNLTVIANTIPFITY